MMIQIPPIFERASIGSMKSKSGVVFDIVIGLDRALVGQLISYSSDDGDHDLHAHTSDRKRFVEGSYEEWFGKDRRLRFPDARHVAGRQCPTRFNVERVTVGAQRKAASAKAGDEGGGVHQAASCRAKSGILLKSGFAT
jgi:hypothetical protein